MISFFRQGIIMTIQCGLIITLSAKAQVTTDGTLGPRGALSGPDYLIGADLGQQRGGNLFHSFETFNLQHSESATFSGPNSVQNVISRVTGYSPSVIDGLIRSEIPNANMYFLNPQGIIFGPNARLDVQGGFHASTADTLRFEDGSEFNAHRPNFSSLTVAPIEAFGFLTNSPASLLVKGSELSVPTEKTLSLIGGNLKIDQAKLLAPFGRINLASLTERGNVIPKYWDLVVSGQLGDILIQEDSQIDTSGEGGGAIYIRGGRFVLENSIVEASTMGTADGIGISIEAEQIIMSGDRTLSVIGIQTQDGNAGEISLKAEKVTLTEASIIASVGFGSGKSSNINVKARQLQLKDGAQIYSVALGTGQGGHIRADVSENIMISGQNATGRPSAFFVSADPYVNFDIFNIDFTKAGESGNLVLKTNELIMKDKAILSASTYGPSKGGTMDIQVRHLQLDASTIFARSLSFPSREYEGSLGDAGTIRLDILESLRMQNDSSISTFAESSGGGNISIASSGNLYLTDSEISSNVQTGRGSGGNINIKSQSFILDSSKIIALAYEGIGGNINIQTTNFFESNSSINASSRFGISGIIRINPLEVDIEKLERLEDTLLSQYMSSTFLLKNKLSINRCAGLTKEDLSRFVTYKGPKARPRGPNDLNTHAIQVTDIPLTAYQTSTFQRSVSFDKNMQPLPLRIGCAGRN